MHVTRTRASRDTCALACSAHMSPTICSRHSRLTTTTENTTRRRRLDASCRADTARSGASRNTRPRAAPAGTGPPEWATSWSSGSQAGSTRARRRATPAEARSRVRRARRTCRRRRCRWPVPPASHGTSTQGGSLAHGMSGMRTRSCPWCRGVGMMPRATVRSAVRTDRLSARALRPCARPHRQQGRPAQRCRPSPRAPPARCSHRSTKPARGRTAR